MGVTKLKIRSKKKRAASDLKVENEVALDTGDGGKRPRGSANIIMKMSWTNTQVDYDPNEINNTGETRFG